MARKRYKFLGCITAEEWDKLEWRPADSGISSSTSWMEDLGYEIAGEYLPSGEALNEHKDARLVYRQGGRYFIIGGGRVAAVEVNDGVITHGEEAKRNAFKEARVECQISRAEMSRMFGIPVRTIENWETGAAKPSAYVGELILERLDSLRFERMEKKDPIRIRKVNGMDGYYFIVPNELQSVDFHGMHILAHYIGGLNRKNRFAFDLCFHEPLIRKMRRRGYPLDPDSQKYIDQFIERYKTDAAWEYGGKSYGYDEFCYMAMRRTGCYPGKIKDLLEGQVGELRNMDLIPALADATRTIFLHEGIYSKWGASDAEREDRLYRQILEDWE